MKRAQRIVVAILVVLLVGVTAAPQGFAQSSAMDSLPPALRAAVLTGNPEMIGQTIQALSGGDVDSMADLATQVVTAAEELVQTNPQAAIQAAAAAVTTVSETPVQTAAPDSTQTVLTTAARIFVNPDVVQVAPEEATAVANATMSAAATTGNAATIATVAAQAVQVAEQILPTNPVAAIALAGTSVTAMEEAVATAQPDEAMTVITTAARIVINPEAQTAAPEAIAGMSVAISTIAATPAVYAASPSGAVTTMASAYSASTSAAVTAAAPEAATTVSDTVTAASQSSALNAISQSTGTQLSGVLSGQTTASDTGEQSGNGGQNGQTTTSDAGEQAGTSGQSGQTTASNTGEQTSGNDPTTPNNSQVSTFPDSIPDSGTNPTIPVVTEENPFAGGSPT